MEPLTTPAMIAGLILRVEGLVVGADTAAMGLVALEQMISVSSVYGLPSLVMLIVRTCAA